MKCEPVVSGRVVGVDLNSAAVLAFSAVSNNDRVGLVQFTDRVERFVPPHKGTRHVGKVPEALRQTRELSDRLKALQKKLGKAVEDENFEQAASLRDEIKQMSARLSNISVG